MTAAKTAPMPPAAAPHGATLGEASGKFAKVGEITRGACYQIGDNGRPRAPRKGLSFACGAGGEIWHCRFRWICSRRARRWKSKHGRMDFPCFMFCIQNKQGRAIRQQPAQIPLERRFSSHNREGVRSGFPKFLSPFAIGSGEAVWHFRIGRMSAWRVIRTRRTINKSPTGTAPVGDSRLPESLDRVSLAAGPAISKNPMGQQPSPNPNLCALSAVYRPCQSICQTKVASLG
ncbi:hypothetical protein R1flu_008549 [Riccia fluitans]|uniref:Uncharacterized protein n=1 Tax=Riccia fluitans TaxID=41844 RepID=A0ABD1YFK6_9MARC